MIPADEPEDATTGLPAVRTWRAVYLWVLASLVLWIALLAALTHAFS